MARCRICQWFSRLFYADESACSDHLRRINDWDRSAAGDIDRWWEEPHYERLTAAAALWDSDPKAAFQAYSELANMGSVHAMLWLGHCYAQGHGTDGSFDKAYDCFKRAITEGSWMATLAIAELLFDNGFDAEGIAFLQNGIECDFIPANFWLARYRLRQSWSRETFAGVRPLLDRAASAGHPGGEALLATAMMFGRYGFKEIRNGFRLMETVIEKREEAEAEEKAARDAGLQTLVTP